MKIFKIVFLIFFIFSNRAFAFGGGSMGSMGGVPGMGGSGSSASAPKSGISIVDPEGNEFNCQPFVDKKWDSTDYADNWNGLYFGIGSEYSFFSGNFHVESSNAIDSNNYVKIPSTFLNKPVNFSGSSNSVVFNLGGGTLIDRMFLGSDMEIRTADLSSNFNFEIEEKNNATTTNSKIKSNYSINVNIIFNAKIGYLLTERVMTYFNAGIGSFSSSDLSTSDKYSLNMENDNIPSPVRLSVGAEYLMSNHFRFYADYSYWVIPKIYGSFRIKSASQNEVNMGESNNTPQSSNTFISKLNVNSVKAGILYRF